MSRQKNISKMYNLALIGKDISHSRSREMYEKILKEKVCYTKYDIQRKSELPSLSAIFEKNIGLSITSPYKSSYLSQIELDSNAKGLSAINCVKKVKDKTFLATNTDFLALNDLLEKMLESFSLPPRIALLGSGHMADLTTRLLKEKELDYIQLSRKQGVDLESYDFTQLVEKQKSLLVINTCSRSFVFSGKISEETVFWDYNYAFPPHEESLPSQCHYWDGLDLLYLQAKYALQFWEIPTEKIG